MDTVTPDIVVHGGDYDHVRGLAGEDNGAIRLSYHARPVQEIFAPMLETRCFEACEFSLANYLILRASGQDWLSAIAVFPYRAFRHSLIVTRRDSPLTDFTQLAGKRIAVDDYSMTAAVWVRELLRSDYGVDHRSITWITRRKQRLPIPSGARVEHSDADQEALLVAGSVDAMLGFTLRDTRLAPSERRLRKLLPDSESAERAYFARTGIYPINHCVVVRNDVLGRMPQLPSVLSNAFAQAKERAYARQAASVLPWGTANWAQDMAMFDGDPLPYGWDATNRHVVSVLAAGLREQGFFAAVPEVDTLFLR